MLLFSCVHVYIFTDAINVLKTNDFFFSRNTMMCLTRCMCVILEDGWFTRADISSVSD